ncbi:GAF domain-containing protein [Nocardia otitidiscaviarum]|uniref:GAF domain-containing protein n=1 Tax=Nocardia otitidiscaviarum TaxID=1823 RepID=UPI001895A3BD|nr:GAF domain-containing protein [Nocardia otitidiscaviarum]MBF6183344.1 DUF5593 domain-containing protein [Nocardia otitidiscaviarum]
MITVQPDAHSTPLERVGSPNSTRPEPGGTPGDSHDRFEGHHLLVECLTGPELEPTVIVDDEGPHRFHRLFRAFRGNGLAHGAPTSVDAVLSLLAEAVSEQVPCQGELPSHGSPMLATCIPILGPSGAVHAVRMQVGDTEPAVVTPVIPLEFDAGFIARFGDSHGPAPTLFRTDTTWTLPALLERVVWLEKRLELIALFDPADPACRWCGSLVIDAPDTKSRRHLWMAVRATSDQYGQRVVRGIIADVTEIVAAPDRDPLTEHLSARTPRGHGSALMDLRTTLMHSFCCCEDPRMILWRHRNPQTHPADMLGLLQVLADLTSNRPAQLALRIRFTDEQPWTTLHATCTPLANYSRPQANIDFWIEAHN